MTTLPTAPPTDRPPDAGRSDPRRRGQLHLSDQVLEKIAGAAAAEIGASRGRSGGLLGIGSHVDPAARPHVDVELSASSVDLTLRVGIAYPGSIRQATTQIRDHVTQQVQQLTGVEVRRLDIDVSFLTVAEADARTGSLR